MSDGSGTQSTVKLGLWLSFAAFVVIVVVFKSRITEIEFGKTKATLVTPEEVKRLPDEERRKFEQELLHRLSDLEQQKQPRPQETGNQAVSPLSARNEPETATIPNLAGNWSSPNGLMYLVTQNANSITIQEVNPLLGGVTAAGGGYINGKTFSIPLYTIVGTRGTLTLSVSDDERQMSGQYQDFVTGAVIPLTLNR